MSNPDRPGELGPQFADERVELPDHLSWEAVSSGIPATPLATITATEKVSGTWLTTWWPWCLAAVVGTVGLLVFGPTLGGDDAEMGIPPASASIVPEPTDQPLPSENLTMTQAGGLTEAASTSANAEKPAEVNNLSSALTTARHSQEARGLGAAAGYDTEHLRGAMTGEKTVTATLSANQRAEQKLGRSPEAQGVLPPSTDEAGRTALRHPEPVPPLAYDLVQSISCVNCLKARPTAGFTPTQGIAPTARAKPSIGLLDFSVGSNLLSGLPGDLTSVPGISAAGAYRINRPSGWSFSVGLRYDEHAWRSQLDRSDRVNLYRPGTVDTIFRDLTTGEERLVTRDSVPGTRITRFTGYGQIRTLGVDLRLGRNWPLLGGRIALFGSVDANYTLSVAGRTVTPEGGISAAADFARAQGGILLNLGGGVRYERHLAGRVGVFGEVSHRFALGQRLQGYERVGQRSSYGGLGLSWRMR